MKHRNLFQGYYFYDIFFENINPWIQHIAYTIAHFRFLSVELTSRKKVKKYTGLKG